MCEPEWFDAVEHLTDLIFVQPVLGQFGPNFGSVFLADIKVP